MCVCAHSMYRVFVCVHLGLLYPLHVFILHQQGLKRVLTFNMLIFFSMSQDVYFGLLSVLWVFYYVARVCFIVMLGITAELF